MEEGIGRWIPQHLKEEISRIADLTELPTYQQMQQRYVDEYNQSVGDLAGFDCFVCKNKGFVQHLEDDTIITRQCECSYQRKAHKRIAESGLSEIVKRYQFENFKTPEKWQAVAKRKALDYVEKQGNWFFIGGQSGAGKTHLCTSICGRLLNQRKQVRYMLWVSDIRNLKSVANDGGYDALFYSFAKAEFLYIDDLFKVKQGVDLTAADIQRTYELINYRYNTYRRTMISSEKSLSEIIAIDEAIGGRIKEQAGGYIVELGQDSRMNWRLH